MEQLSVFFLNLYRKDYLFPLLKLSWASVWLHFHTSFLGAGSELFLNQISICINYESNILVNHFVGTQLCVTWCNQPLVVLISILLLRGIQTKTVICMK